MPVTPPRTPTPNPNVHHPRGLTLGQVSSHPDSLRAFFNLADTNTQTHLHQTNHQVSL